MSISTIENFFRKLLGVNRAFADDPGTTGGNVTLPNPLGTDNIVEMVNE